MRGPVLIAVLIVAVVGCATPVVLEDPATRRRVDCTLEAQRLAYEAPDPSIGTDVPWTQRAAPPVTAFDLEQRCIGTLLREGFVCVSGCRTTPR